MLRKFFCFLLIFLSLSGKVFCGEEKQWKVNQTVVDDVISVVITSESKNSSVAQKEIRFLVEYLVNGGLYDILDVETFYSQDGFLIKSKVDYKDRMGDGNNLRVVFIHSIQELCNRNNYITKRLETSLTNKKHEILRVRKIYSSECLVAAEIYYFSLE